MLYTMAALDLQIIVFTASGRIQCATWPNPAFVDGDYGLIQTLYKCLLTDPGDDAFDPDWGAGLMSGLRPLHGDDDQGAAKVVTTALGKATSDLQEAYPGLRISASRVEYVLDLTSWQVDLLLETTDGILEVSLPV
jgi:hypothetical protein